WWSRPIATLPAPDDRKATSKELAAYFSPLWGGLLTAIAMFLIFLFTDEADPHAKFSIQSIAISPSTATYHVDFLVRNPSSRYSIYYDDRDASVRFGDVNVAVFKIIRERSYRDHTAFSLAFDAGEVINGTDVELHIKLRGMHERYIDYDEAGHFDTTCHIRSKENIEKINCHSGFTHMRMLLFASSVTVSNANANTNISTADWRVGLVAKSPVTRCKISLHTSKSRLLRGDHEVVSGSAPWLDGFGQFFTSYNTYEPVTSVDFKGVEMPGVVGDLVRGYKVEIAVAVKADGEHVFLIVLCGDLPVKLTADPKGNVIGSLLGNMKRCEYVVGDNLNIHV
ncbi:unnamed protein product, partial [Brassica napus]